MATLKPVPKSKARKRAVAKQVEPVPDDDEAVTSVTSASTSPESADSTVPFDSIVSRTMAAFRAAVEKASRDAIQSMADAVGAEITPKVTEFVRESTRLEAVTDRFRRMEAFHKSHAATLDPSQRVVINAGGTRFETTVFTLCAQEDTYFAKVFGGLFPAPSARDDSGAILYYVDIDPRYFEVFLNYMRTGQFPKHQLDPKVMQSYQERYFIGDVVATTARDVVETAMPTDLYTPGLNAHLGVEYRVDSRSSGPFDSLILAPLTKENLARGGCSIKTYFEIELPKRCTVIGYRMSYGGSHPGDSGDGYSRPCAWVVTDQNDRKIHKYGIKDCFRRAMTVMFPLPEPATGVRKLRFRIKATAEGNARFAIKCLEVYGSVEEGEDEDVEEDEVAPPPLRDDDDDIEPESDDEE